jgi:hypothetical protein
MSLQCPDCGSARIRSKAAVYMAGTRDSHRSYRGGGMTSHGNLAGFIASSDGLTSSRLAAACAPPDSPPPRVSLFGLIAAGFAAFASAFLSFGVPFALVLDHARNGLCIGAIAGVLWASLRIVSLADRTGERWERSRDEYVRAQSAYHKTFICLTCLHEWQRNTHP